MDESYGFATNKDRIDSCTWTNDKLCIFTAQEYDNVAYPEKRYYNFTAFMVPDSILAEKYGITNLDGLRAKAKELYEPMYPEDACVQMELLGHNFYVFRNAETDEVNVVYKRKGNTYGLIEPEF